MLACALCASLRYSTPAKRCVESIRRGGVQICGTVTYMRPDGCFAAHKMEWAQQSPLSTRLSGEILCQSCAQEVKGPSMRHPSVAMRVILL